MTTAGLNLSMSLLPSPTDRLHASASNPNLLHYSNERNVITNPHGQGPVYSAVNDLRLQEMKLRESFLNKSETGMFFFI